MTDPKTEIQEAKPPRCPHCGADMPRVNQFSWAGSTWLILAVYCESCLTLLKMSIIPLAVADPDSPQGSRIAKPS